MMRCTAFLCGRLLPAFLVFLTLPGLLSVEGRPTDPPAPPEPRDYSTLGKFSLRIGEGISIPLVDIEFNDTGTLQGQTADVLKDDVDSPIHYAMGLAMKYGLFSGSSPGRWTGSIGLRLDYQIMPIDDLFIKAERPGMRLEATADMGDLHVLSFFPFFEVRSSAFVVQPYLQLGIGFNYNIQDFNERLFKLDNSVSFGFFASGGAEWFVTPRIAIFLEPRWQYNRGKATFTPLTNSRFNGKINLDSVTVLTGVTFYFGGSTASVAE